ncbi:DinB family protein [Paenibacillus jiagnxiensis]|uniref:DinB family protein n=1 Tax=Paenibacillus jiagnxiensis TaxID=3228926 RepID=UPI0033AA0B8C
MALIDEFDESFSVLSALLSGIEEEQLSAEWTLKQGEQILFEQPRLLALRSIGINHMIHYRAQITVYLRLLNQPVPGLYGPSSDDIAAMAR